MNFTLAIYAPPRPHGAADRAYKFARAAIDQGHSIYRLFFFNEGVLNCAACDDALCRQWRELIEQQQLDAITCIASAEKRGLNQARKDKAKTDDKTVHPVFNIGGIAQLIDATAHADRVITFAE